MPCSVAGPIHLRANRTDLLRRFVRQLMISGAILVYCITLFGGFYYVSSVALQGIDVSTSDPGGMMCEHPSRGLPGLERDGCSHGWKSVYRSVRA